MTDGTAFDHAVARVRAGDPAEDAARALVQEMTPDERLWCLDGDVPALAGLATLGADGYHRAAFPAARIPRLGVPGFSFADGPRGAVIGNATCFPVAMARGATWDVELEERVGAAIGRELRALGADLTGAVCINLLRHPAWGRAQETYGEDPFHVGELGAAATRGLQQSVMACVKHFAVNSMENMRFSVDVEVDDVALHEVYLPHFKRVVDEGVFAVMSAYNSVNGEWAGQNTELLTTVLRQEWGFPGFVISDWIFGLRDAATSVTAGLDVEMPWRMVRAEHLPAALEDGRVTPEQVDVLVTRLVATLLRFHAGRTAPAPELAVVGCDEHRALAREAAAASAVLLKNDAVDGVPVLPLAPGRRLAVLGRLADQVNVGDGGSSDVWDLACCTVLDGLRNSFPDLQHDDGTDLERAVRVAAAADTAVVVVGYTYVDEGEYIGGGTAHLAWLFPKQDDPDLVEQYTAEFQSWPKPMKPEHLHGRGRGFAAGGDRRSLELLPSDAALVRAVASANPRTVVILQAGSAVVVEEWVETVPAIVQAFYGGAEAGSGLTDVLSGRCAPSGRLPFSVPRSAAHLPDFDPDAACVRYDGSHGWWHLRDGGFSPRFAFGHGLGYTSFRLSSADLRRGDGVLIAEVEVQNTGEHDGVDVVQVYVDLPGGASRLGGFARVKVPSGGRATAEVVVPLERLARREPATKSWSPARGDHVVRVARTAHDPAERRLRVRL